MTASSRYRAPVENYSERRAAAHNVESLDDLYKLDDQLKVIFWWLRERREDDEIRGVALQALIWDTEVPVRHDRRQRPGWLAHA